MPREPRRIIVALDASAHSRAALEAAAALAARLGVEVVGLFVEDLELVNLARFPFARESGLSSASRRSLDPVAMERALKAQAAQARATLEAVARRYGVPWSFRVTRGQVANELLAAAAEADLLALGRTGHMEATGRRVGSTVRRIVTEARCSVLVQQRLPHPGRTVVLLHESTKLSDYALTPARELAESYASELVVVMCGPPGTRDEATRRVQTALQGASVPVRIDTLDDGIPALRSLLERHRGSLVIVADDSPLLAKEPDLVGELSVPVLLVRSSAS